MKKKIKLHRCACQRTYMTVIGMMRCNHLVEATPSLEEKMEESGSITPEELVEWDFNHSKELFI